jgi:hypothetical protein
MQAGAVNAYGCVKALSETDFTEDLKKFDFPTLVLHGEDDQIVPVTDSARKSAKLIKGAEEIYPEHPTGSQRRTRTRSTLIGWPEQGSQGRQSRLKLRFRTGRIHEQRNSFQTLRRHFLRASVGAGGEISLFLRAPAETSRCSRGRTASFSSTPASQFQNPALRRRWMPLVPTG